MVSLAIVTSVSQIVGQVNEVSQMIEIVRQLLNQAVSQAVSQVVN